VVNVETKRSVTATHVVPRNQLPCFAEAPILAPLALMPLTTVVTMAVERAAVMVRVMSASWEGRTS
jgi:hypothetical protein